MAGFVQALLPQNVVVAFNRSVRTESEKNKHEISFVLSTIVRLVVCFF